MVCTCRRRKRSLDAGLEKYTPPATATSCFPLVETCFFTTETSAACGVRLWELLLIGL